MIKRYLPKIEPYHLHKDIAGIRPKIQGDGDDVSDFQFCWAEDNGWLDLWGMESPALTTSLAIGEYVYKLIKSKGVLD